MFRATVSAPFSDALLCNWMMNSSPLKRATESKSRIQFFISSLICLSKSSPALWPWIQSISAFTPTYTSHGVFQPRRLRGRKLIFAITRLTVSTVSLLKSLPLGKCCRNRPLYFPLCRDGKTNRGQENTLGFRSSRRCLCLWLTNSLL